MKKGYTQDEIFAVIFESEREKERRRILEIVSKTFNAHRLEKMKEHVAYKKLATWRRMNGFDRVVESEENWFHGHRSLPSTPQEYYASLRHELQKTGLPKKWERILKWERTATVLYVLKSE